MAATAGKAEAGPWKLLLPALRLWLLLLLVVGVTGIVGRNMEQKSPWLLVVGNLAMLPLVIGYGWRSRSRWLGLLRYRGFAGRPLGLAAVALVIAVAWILAYYLVMQMLGVGSLNLVDEFVAAGWPVWTAFVCLSLYPAVIEEIAFRGIIQSTLEQVGSPREALLIQAGMFSFLHLNPAMFVSHFGLGFILGMLRLRTRSLYPAMLVHALLNGWLLWRDARVLGAL